MTILRNFGCLALSFLLAQFCWAEEEPRVLSTIAPSEEPYFRLFIEGNNRLGFALYGELKQERGNILFSPYALATNLGMAFMASDGLLAAQFHRLLGYGSPLLLFIGDCNACFQRALAPKSRGALALSDNFWIDRTLKIKPSFSLLFQQSFRSKPQFIAFQGNRERAVREINERVSQESGGLVRDIAFAQDFEASTLLMLSSAAAIKNGWASSFDPRRTQVAPFYFDAQRSAAVPMMEQTALYPLWKGDKWALLRLAYASEGECALAMTLILPSSGVPLREVEQALTYDNWKKWNSEFKETPAKLKLPVFQLEKRYTLKGVLKQMGLNRLFNQEADLSLLAEETAAGVASVIHKAVLKVDEAGLNTRFETALREGQKSELSSFVLDHPFIVLISEVKTGAILFIGRIETPW